MVIDDKIFSDYCIKTLDKYEEIIVGIDNCFLLSYLWLHFGFDVLGFWQEKSYPAAIYCFKMSLIVR